MKIHQSLVLVKILERLLRVFGKVLLGIVTVDLDGLT